MNTTDKSRNDHVLLAVSTPMSDRPTVTELPADLSLGQAVHQIVQAAPATESDGAAQHLLRLELSGQYDMVARDQGGRLMKVEATRALRDIAFDRAVRDAGGELHDAKIAVVTIASYQRVGIGAR